MSSGIQVGSSSSTNTTDPSFTWHGPFSVSMSIVNGAITNINGGTMSTEALKALGASDIHCDSPEWSFKVTGKGSGVFSFHSSTAGTISLAPQIDRTASPMFVQEDKPASITFQYRFTPNTDESKRTSLFVRHTEISLEGSFVVTSVTLPLTAIQPKLSTSVSVIALTPLSAEASKLPKIESTPPRGSSSVASKTPPPPAYAFGSGRPIFEGFAAPSTSNLNGTHSASTSQAGPSVDRSNGASTVTPIRSATAGR